MTDLVVTFPHIEGFVFILFLGFLARQLYIYYQNYLLRRNNFLHSMIVGVYSSFIFNLLSKEDSLSFLKANNLRRSRNLNNDSPIFNHLGERIFQNQETRTDNTDNTDNTNNINHTFN